MPGAIAIGYLAHSPMSAVPTAAAIAVATATSSAGIPVVERICGLTNRM